MMNALFIYSPKGELIVCKLMKDSVKRSVSEVFRIQVINNIDIRSPILTLGSTTFHYIRSTGNLWIATASRSNADSAAIWEFLFKLNSMMNVYNINCEEVLKEEFMICYELLDILLENGMPQDTEVSNVIQMMSQKPDNNLLLDDILMNGGVTMPKFLKNSVRMDSDITDTISNNCSWRPEGIKYKKNEVYLDVDEKINLLVGKDGTVLKAHVDGKVNCTTHLSGMPVCQFGLNDSLSLGNNPLASDLEFVAEYEVKNRKAIPKAAAGSVLLEDCKFHQCVQLNKFNKDRIIRFIPPDGTFELMKYHVKDNVNLPFKITPIVMTTKNNHLEYRITLKSLFPSKLTAKDVLLTIPVPPGFIEFDINVSNGKCKFSTEQQAIIWKFSKYQGLTENSLVVIAIPSKSSLPSINYHQWSKPPIALKFEILMFSNSGLVVRFFKVSEKKLKYHTVKWVKYISSASTFEIRY